MFKPSHIFVDLGWLDRITPISVLFGFDRGKPIDRYYIENFLAQHSNDIKGRVLEVEDNQYTRMFGGSRVTKSDILHVVGNSHSTIIADLTKADSIASNSFDCIILTQTLQFIYDLKPAIRHLHRILKPGGILLVTVPGISQISRHDMDRWGDYWRFTTLSIQKLFEEAFPPANIETQAYGNVLTAIAFLHGLAVEELTPEKFQYNDPDYQLLLTVRAIKNE